MLCLPQWLAAAPTAHEANGCGERKVRMNTPQRVVENLLLVTTASLRAGLYIIYVSSNVNSPATLKLIIN